MNIFSRIKDRLFGGNIKTSRTAQIITTPGTGGVVWPQRNYENFAKETYLKNVIAYKSIDEIAKSVASVPWEQFMHLSDGGREKILDDPVINALKRPNPDEGLPSVILRATAYLVMSGNSFLERITPETGPNRGVIQELYSLRPDRFKLKINSGTGRLERYVYTVSGRTIDWEVDPITGQCDVLHLKSFHPLDDWWGAAATESAAREIDTSNAATQWNKSILDNEGRPGMVFTLIGALGEEAFDGLEKHLREDHGGAANAGKNLIITGDKGTKAEPYGWSPKDLDFNEGDLRLARKIASGYGVPPMIIGIPGEATFANYKEARLAFWETTVFFYLNYFKEELNNWLFEKDSKMFIDYNLDDVPALAVKRDMLWKRAQESDFLEINEKREMVGLEAKNGGDVILIAANMIPLGEAGEIEIEEEEEEAREDLLEQGYSDDDIDEMFGLPCDEKKTKYKCECLSCGHKLTSEKHCNTLKCPKCGGKMRREERPGTGRDDEPDESKPYPTEYSCRLESPDKYDRFARVNCYRKHNGKCIDFIFGIKDEKSEVQALRYKKKIWTAVDAKSHCKSKDGNFEA